MTFGQSIHGNGNNIDKEIIDKIKPSNKTINDTINQSDNNLNLKVRDSQNLIINESNASNYIKQRDNNSIYKFVDANSQS